MKPFFIFTAVFFLTGIYSVTVQDIIILKNGNMIEAVVVETSQTEIKYKRFDYSDGPTIIIPSFTVLSIKYENENYIVINDIPKPE